MKLHEILERDIVTAAPVGGDITEEAIKRGWVLPFAEGQFVYGAEWTRLMRRLQELLLSRAAAMGFEEYLFPRLIPAEAVRDFKLSQFKPELLWRVDEHGKVLDPVQCLSFYQVLRGSRFNLDQLPLRVVETMGGWTWRREQPEELDGVFRAVEFSRVEHIWMGTPEQVREIRGQVLASVVELVSELGLSTQVVVGEGCMPIEEIERRRDEASRIDDVPVVDVELRVAPEATVGEVTPQDFEEISGCTIEGDHHLKSFDVGRTDGGPLWSGCCGVGLNRLMAGFLFQHGFDRADWPDLVKRDRVRNGG